MALVLCHGLVQYASRQTRHLSIGRRANSKEDMREYQRNDSHVMPYDVQNGTSETQRTK